MDSAEAVGIVIHEGTAINGMVIETRAGIDPGQHRVSRLCDALAIVMDFIAADSHLERRLANALYGLSFHMSETLRHWQKCDWISDYTVMLEHIETIFEGPAEWPCPTNP